MSVELRLYLMGEDGRTQGLAEYRTEDRAVIDGLVPLLAKAEAAEQHKCGDVGFLDLTTRARRKCHLRILPGHFPAYYEFRAGKRGAFRVPRPEFLALMERMGAANLPLGPEGEEKAIPLKGEKQGAPAIPPVW